MKVSIKSSPKLIILSSILSLGVLGSNAALASDTVPAEVKETASDVVTGAKKVGRAVSDKTCEVVNGEEHCAVRKGKHKLKNAADKVLGH